MKFNDNFNKIYTSLIQLTKNKIHMDSLSLNVVDILVSHV